MQKTESKVTAVHSDYSDTVTGQVGNRQEVKCEVREKERQRSTTRVTKGFRGKNRQSQGEGQKNI